MRAAAWLLVLGACLPVAVAAQTDAPARGDGEYTADMIQRSVSENLNGAARWIDSFFDDERYQAEDASTKLRFGEQVLLEFGDSPEFKTRLNLSVDVPRTENKLRLFIGSEDNTDNPADTLSDSVEDENDSGGSTAGLQFFAKSSNRRNLSLSAGIKASSAEVFVGPRYRQTVRLSDWQMRFTQRVRWYTSRGWESRTGLDFERLLGDKLFFRQSFDGRWREEDPGYRYEISSSIIQPIRQRKAIVYQWLNLLETHPQQRLRSTVLRIRYRQNFLRKWLFYEMNPQIAMRNEEHFKPKPGIVLRIDVVFGGKRYYRKRQPSELMGDAAAGER